jgi:hypothetical protein
VRVTLQLPPGEAPNILPSPMKKNKEIVAAMAAGDAEEEVENDEGTAGAQGRQEAKTEKCDETTVQAGSFTIFTSTASSSCDDVFLKQLQVMERDGFNLIFVGLGSESPDVIQYISLRPLPSARPGEPGVKEEEGDVPPE